MVDQGRPPRERDLRSMPVAADDKRYLEWSDLPVQRCGEMDRSAHRLEHGVERCVRTRSLML